MNELWNKIKSRYFRGNTLIRLVFINVAVFLIAATINIFGTLFKLNPGLLFHWFELPSNLLTLLVRPWTLISYMFFHLDFFHILFNMLWLYWFGNMFLRRFSEKQLLAVYIMGGLLGGLCYIVLYNILPIFDNVSGFSYLLGASASVLAIVVATALRDPNDEVLLMFLGAVKLKYIAVFVVLLSFLNIVSENAGGNIAHLGGALFGFVFMRYYKKGRDITRPLTNILAKIASLFKPKSKFKVHKNENIDMKFNRRKKADIDEIDAILDKMKRTGYDGLTNEEKRKLFNAGKK